MIVTIKDRSGRTLLYGTVDNVTVTDRELVYVLTRIHKSCILEEERLFTDEKPRFCSCDEKP